MFVKKTHHCEYCGKKLSKNILKEDEWSEAREHEIECAIDNNWEKVKEAKSMEEILEEI